MARKMGSSPTKGGHERSKRKLNTSEKEPFSPFHKLRPPRSILLDAHGPFSFRQIANAQQRGDGTLIKQTAEPAWSEMFMPKWQASPKLLTRASCFRFLVQKKPSFAKLVRRERKTSLAYGLSCINALCTMTSPHATPRNHTHFRR